jgi:hypothetical protein
MTLRIEGYVIVSADGMLANSSRVMPDALKFKGDKQFFTAALDRADLVVHGRNSYEFAKAQAHHPHHEDCLARCGSFQSQRHALESGWSLI